MVCAILDQGNDAVMAEFFPCLSRHSFSKKLHCEKILKLSVLF